MNKSFFLGVLTGAILTFAGLLFIGLAYSGDENSIEYLNKPISYENKTEASFKVFQVLEDAALAKESKSEKDIWYLGNTVLITGDNFYTDQVVTIKNPQRVGTFNYTDINDMPMTVPVLVGEVSE